MKQENATGGPSPPSWFGGNLDTNPLDRFLFYCNGDRIDAVDRIPSQCQRYQTHSVYYQNERFWIINYDAIDNPIGDDHPPEQRGTPDSDRWIGWCDLMFNWDDATGISHATVAGGHPRLLQQHSDHDWPRYLLPTQYHAETVTVDDREGGLNGEISLIIALVTLTMYPTRFVPGAFQAGRWRLQDWISTCKYISTSD